MNKICTFFLTSLLLSHVCLAQQPSWVDYDQREANFPKSKYLTGFTIAEGRALSEALMGELTGSAKKNLIESIKVSVESVSISELQSVNSSEGNSYGEKYLNKTVAVADADVVGLKTETYYNRKTKEAYAFAYASRVEVINYYENFIKVALGDVQKSVENGRSFAAANNLGNALTTLLEANDKLFEVKKAQGLLVALGQDNPSVLMTTQSSSLERQVLQSIDNVLKSDNLSIEHLSTYFAYIVSQLNWEPQDKIYLRPSTFNKYDLTSTFGEQLDLYLSQSLTNKKVNISSSKSSPFYIAPDYNDTDKDVLVGLEIKSTDDKVVAALSGRVATSFLKRQKVNYLPRPIQKLRTLDGVKLTPVQKSVNVVFNEAIPRPFELTASSSTGANVQGIPLLYQHKDVESIKGKVSTNASGKASIAIQKISFPKKLQFLNVTVDVAEFTGLDEESEILQSLVSNYTLPKTNFIIKLGGLGLYIDANETLLGKDYSEDLVTNKIKEEFTSMGFSFVDNPDDSNFYLDVKVGSNSGGEFSGIYFSYANVTISLTNLKNGEEIFTKTYLKIKGGGGSFEDAALKAYNKAALEVSKDLANVFQQ